jgi:hypothetical protein
MENNKGPFAARFFRGALKVALVAAFVIMAAGHVRDIHRSRAAIARAQKALESSALPPGRLSGLEARLAELRIQERAREDPEVGREDEDPAGAIRDALRSHAVRVERLRMVSTGGAAGTEFVLAGAPADFLRFLRGAPELPLPLNYISIKPRADSPAMDITMRFSHAP